MKCIILLTLVTLCYSYPYGNTAGRSVNINEDGTIVITGTNGKQVTITKAVGPAGQKNIDIAVSGPNIPTKRIQINENNDVNVNSGKQGEFDINDEYQRDKRNSRDSKRRSQADTLTEILEEYQGVVDDRSYEQLLQKLSSAVRSGQLSESVFNVLQSLNQGQLPEGGEQNILRQQNQNIGEGPVTILALLRRQQLEDLLQQQQVKQGGYYGASVPVYGQQQIWTYGQKPVNPIQTGRGVRSTAQEVILEIPTENQQGQIIERVLVDQPQVTLYPGGQGLVYGVRAGDVSGLGIGANAWGWGSRNPQGISLYDLLNTYNAQQQGVSMEQYGPQPMVSRMISDER